MEYQWFRELVKGKEKAHVDFKLECHAFKARTTEPKAELAKDICAMANNGNIASYIVIGVSDDGKTFKSVENEKLTDEHLQSFCRRAISPPPRVKLIVRSWPRAVHEKHRGKTFVVIQVGPQARGAYRLGQDFIAYKESVCYRRNEVWIRRGSTCDLAAPAEIANLVQGHAVDYDRSEAAGTVYSRLPRNEQLSSLYRDVKDCIEEMGGMVRGLQAVLRVKRAKFVLRLLVIQRWGLEYEIWHHTCRDWAYEHGVLVVSLDSFTSKSFPGDLRINCKETWGWFSVFDIASSYHQAMSAKVPSNTTRASVFILTLPGVKDSLTLRRQFRRMADFLGSNDDVYELLRSGKRDLNRNLRRWLNEGWISPSGRWLQPGSKPSGLAKNEIVSRRRFGHEVMKRERGSRLENAAKTILSLS